MDELISVIMPTFRRGAFIERAIESVQSQTYENMELIIIDDNGAGSEEQTETEEKIRRYLTDRRIRYIKNEKNLGGSLARNSGVNHSRGKYITFLDDDDCYFPEKLRIQYEKMEKYNLDISIVDDEVRDGKGKLIKRTSRRLREFPEREDLLREHLLHHITGTNDMMLRRDFYYKIQGFDDIEAGQEYILMLKAIAAGGKFGYISQVLVTFYEHNYGRISTNLSKIQAQKKLLEIKKEYFTHLNKSEQNYVRCRNHMVCAFIYMKNRKFMRMLRELLFSLRISARSSYDIVRGSK